MKTKTNLPLAFLLASAATALSSSALAAGMTGGSFQLGIGPTLAILGGQIGYGGTVNLKFRSAPDVPLYFGVETGLVHWEQGQGLAGLTGSTSLNSIPILGLIEYQFEIADSSIRPYIGVAPGVSMTLYGATLASETQPASAGQTNVQFEALVKPGVAIGSFFIEPKFGVLNGEFIFLPTVGVVLGF